MTALPPRVSIRQAAIGTGPSTADPMIADGTLARRSSALQHAAVASAEAGRASRPSPTSPWQARAGAAGQSHMERPLSISAARSTPRIQLSGS